MKHILLLTVLAGCAHTTSRASTPAEPRPVAAVAPTPENEWHRHIRVVTHRPAHYVFVGKVRGSAPNEDFVDAAKRARTQLARRAEALGADVVKIDQVEPASRGNVLIAGRAYRLAD